MGLIRVLEPLAPLHEFLQCELPANSSMCFFFLWATSEGGGELCFASGLHICLLQQRVVITGVMATSPPEPEALTLSSHFPKLDIFLPVASKPPLLISLSLPPSWVLFIPASVTYPITFIQFQFSVFESFISSLHIQWLLIINPEPSQNQNLFSLPSLPRSFPFP